MSSGRRGTKLPVLATAEVITRLDEARRNARAAPRPPIVVFDADGTLWKGDIGDDTFDALVRARAVRREALGALRETAASFGTPLCDDPNDQARALCEAFLSGAFPARHAYAMMAWVFAGYTPDEVRAFAGSVIRDVDLAGRAFAEVRPILGWARDERVPIYVVSASPLAVVEEALEKLDFAVDRVFGMTPRIDGGKIAPAVVLPLPYDTGKPEVLAQAAPGAVILGAFGDSAADLPMLALAEVRVAVCPKPRLVAEAEESAGLVELFVAGDRDP